MSNQIIYNIFFMLGGIAIMMFGMKFMGANLEQVAGNKMKVLLGKMTTNRFACVGVGAVVTAIINSSTATTVMLVGFVNVGLMTLSQATSVIMGANIGTTITAQILSPSGADGLDINAIACLICAFGIILTMVSKKDSIKKIGYIFIGLGMIFIGLKLMSKSVNSIIYDKEGKLLPVFNKIFQNENIFPLLLVLIGIVFTALIQSSAAITGILIAFGSAINFRTAVFIILGSNIGTCITSIISSIGTSTNAKRTAIIHLLFNLFGCILFIVPVWIWTSEIQVAIEAVSGDSMQRIIANFHTIFNLVTTILLLPFTKVLVRISTRLVPDKKQEESDKKRLMFIDDRLFATPAVAVGNTKKEILRMADIAKQNLKISTSMLFDSKDEGMELFNENEEAINTIYSKITDYLTKLMGMEISSMDDEKVSSYYHVISDIERIGDYAENITEYAIKLKEEKINLSNSAIEELKHLIDLLNELFYLSMKAFDNRDFNLLQEVNDIEDKIDDYTQELENKHIERVKEGNCTATAGSVYLQTVSDLERIGDHINNVAQSMKKYQKHYKISK